MSKVIVVLHLCLRASKTDRTQIQIMKGITPGIQHSTCKDLMLSHLVLQQTTYIGCRNLLEASAGFDMDSGIGLSGCKPYRPWGAEKTVRNMFVDFISCNQSFVSDLAG